MKEKRRNIRLFKPSLGNEEVQAIKKIFKRSWIGYGQEVKKFEDVGVNILVLNIQPVLLLAQRHYILP